jgi:hypothetical protein
MANDGTERLISNIRRAFIEGIIAVEFADDEPPQLSYDKDTIEHIAWWEGFHLANENRIGRAARAISQSPLEKREKGGLAVA